MPGHSRMFDAAFPDGLLSLEGWPFECRGRTWMIHLDRPKHRHQGETIYFVSDEETGFRIGNLLTAAATRAKAKRLMLEFLSKVSDKQLAQAVAQSKAKRPTNRITE